MTFTQIERERVPVLSFTVDGAPDEAAQSAFAQLEQALPSLQGRHFYGYFDFANHCYAAAVERREGDDADALGLEEGALPGGSYLRARLRGEPPELYAQIGPAFDELAQQAKPDQSRPWLEFYRREDEVDVLLPVAE